jgi:hypothetical protein
VLGQVLNVNLTEIAKSAVHGYECAVYALDLHALEQFTAEMHAGCRSGYGTLIRSEYGLETLIIASVVGSFLVKRDLDDITVLVI